MNEKPLERLNYFNGQRLQAADFKLEQDYHVRVRRWLNRSLYSAGIASGLQVYAVDGAPQVRVLPGLAIDSLGREIILLEEQIVDVVGQHNSQGGCIGPYLTIRYQEEIIEQSTDYCVPCTTSSNKPAEKGPARILADPVLELNAILPNDASGKVALACISLAAGCGSIDSVDASVRKYIGAASVATVKQYALEGVRDIDTRNSARIYFHVRGRQPNSVTLFLRVEKFPTLFYTELGTHTHGTTNSGFSVTVPEHDHSIPAIEGRTGSTSTHSGDTPSNGDIRATTTNVTSNPVGGWAIELVSPPIVPAMPSTVPLFDTSDLKDRSLVNWTNITIQFNPLPDHWHSIPSRTDPQAAQTIQLSGQGQSAASGVSDVSARDDSLAPPQKALTYVNNMQIEIDGHNVTLATCTQIGYARPEQNWSVLGNGQGDHPIVDHGRGFSDEGTGPIRIDYLPGVVLDEGEHFIDFSVSGDGNGGRIHFNLYVE